MTELALISNYKSTMYLSAKLSAKQSLKTGDIVELSSKDFDKFLEHDSMKNLLKQFEKDKPNRPNYWVVLNKACDMVHEGSRSFDTNLFLCPLLGLREQIRRGQLSRRLRHIETNKSPYKKFTEILKKSLSIMLREDNKIQTEEAPEAYGKRIEKQTEASLVPIVNYLKEIENEDNPDDFESASIGAVEKAATISVKNFIKEIFSSKPWLNYKKEYLRISNQSENIIFLANSADTLTKLCNNQLESEGIFFFEPHRKIFKKNYDLAYVIEFEDILTLKVRDSFQKSGKIIETLQNSKVLSLHPKFSSRLQNMMGAYFSKIGTDDILNQNVMDLYANYFSKDMYININIYNEKNKP